MGGYSPSDEASQSNRGQGQLTPASSGGLCQPLSHPTATSPSPGVCSNSWPLSRRCHPAISSSVTPFSSCLQSFPASGSFHRVAKRLKNQPHSFQWATQWLSGKEFACSAKMQYTQVRSLGLEDLLEEETARDSSILAWRIPWTEEPGGLQSVGSQTTGYNWTAEHADTGVNSFQYLLLEQQ